MDNRIIQLILKLKDEVSDELKGVSKNVDAVKTKSDRLEKSFGDLRTVTLASAGAFTGLSLAALSFVREAGDAEAAQVRLGKLLQNSTGATSAQVDALKRQAQALQDTGVIGADVITVAQGQLATFDLQAESIERLIPSLVDYIAAEKGIGASAQDAAQMANSLAQAMNGNFGALTKVGFVLDDVTKEMISNGTEMERVEAIASVLDSTYVGMGETLRNTMNGQLWVLQQRFLDIKSSIGDALIMFKGFDSVMGVIDKFTQKLQAWIKENPELVKNIVLLSIALTGIVTVVGAIGLILPTVISGFTLVASAAGAFLSPVGAIIGLLGILYIALKDNAELVDALKAVWLMIKDAWDSQIKPAFLDMWEMLKSHQEEFKFLAKVITTILVVALYATVAVIMQLWEWGVKLTTWIVGTALDAVEKWRKAWEALTSPLTTVQEKLLAIWDVMKNIISNVGKMGGGGAVGLVGNAIGSVVNLFRANGGHVAAGSSYVVGEKGPELFVPSSSGNITPNGAMGGSVTVIVNGDVTGMELVNKVEEAIMGKLRDNMRIAI